MTGVQTCALPISYHQKAGCQHHGRDTYVLHLRETSIGIPPLATPTPGSQHRRSSPDGHLGLARILWQVLQSSKNEPRRILAARSSGWRVRPCDSDVESQSLSSSWVAASITRLRKPAAAVVESNAAHGGQFLGVQVGPRRPPAPARTGYSPIGSLSIRGCVAGFRQDFDPNRQPDVRPTFPDDSIWIPVGVPDVDDDCIFHEIIYDATRIALQLWARAKTADPNVELPFATSVDYESFAAVCRERASSIVDRRWCCRKDTPKPRFFVRETVAICGPLG